MKNLIIPGILGIVILVGFLGVVLGGIKKNGDQAPLIIIAVFVVLLLVYDFYLEIKATRGSDK